MASEELQKHLEKYSRLIEKKNMGAIAEGEFEKKRSKLSNEIRDLVDIRITTLEDEKDRLVFRLSDLEDLINEGMIRSEQYETENTSIRERLLEMDSELSKLEAGRSDIGKLEYKRPQIVVLGKHFVLFMLFLFIASVLYIAGEGWIDIVSIEESVIYHIKKPFGTQELEKKISEKKATLQDDTNLSLEALVLNPMKLKKKIFPRGAVEVTYIKPPSQIEIVDVKIINTITKEPSDCTVSVNDVDIGAGRVVLPKQSEEFTISLSDCKNTDSPANQKTISITIKHDVITGDIRTRHVSRGEIEL